MEKQPGYLSVKKFLCGNVNKTKQRQSKRWITCNENEENVNFSLTFKKFSDEFDSFRLYGYGLVIS